MTTITTEQLVVNNEYGVPKGLLVMQATYNADGSFARTIRHELSVLPASSIAAMNAEIESLKTDKATLEVQAASLKSASDLEIAALEKAKETLEAKVMSLQALPAAMQSQIDRLNESHSKVLLEVEELKQYRPFDPNVIRSEAFYKRITGDELFKLGVLALTDENAKGVVQLLNAYLMNEWKVLLDDPQVVGAMQYLIAIGLLSTDRSAEILRPASKEEAYIE